MPSILPLEIEETILNLLDEDDQHHSAMKTCSLVCRAFLPICRKHIFGSIVLDDLNVVLPPTIHALKLERLLRETPEIADYIRKLDYTFMFRITNFTTGSSSPSIQGFESLKRISRLEFLSVQHHHESVDWSNNPIRPTLLHLLQLPTLTHFTMSRFRNFVVSDLLPCVNLKYLNFAHFTTVAPETTFPAALPEHSIQLNEFVAGIKTSAAIMKLCTARRPDGQSIIDFGSLSKITVVSKRPNDDEALQELFRRCHALTSVHIFFLQAWHEPSLPDMLRSSMQTLKHIVLNINVNGPRAYVDLLSVIPSELEDMRTKNIIETVTIRIVVHWQIVASHLRGDEWGRLDEVLTTPGWFSLKRVSLAIDLDRFGMIDELEMEMAMQELAETQFPRLSSSNSVSFDFTVNE